MNYWCYVSFLHIVITVLFLVAILSDFWCGFSLNIPDNRNCVCVRACVRVCVCVWTGRGSGHAEMYGLWWAVCGHAQTSCWAVVSFHPHSSNLLKHEKWSPKIDHRSVLWNKIKADERKMKFWMRKSNSSVKSTAVCDIFTVCKYMHGVALRFVSAGNTGIGKAVHSKGVSILSAIIIHMLFKSWVGVIFLCFFKKSLCSSMFTKAAFIWLKIQ